MRKHLVIGLVFALAATVAGAQEQIAIGASAPNFTLVNAVDGEQVAFKGDDNNLKVVVFTCNQCPYAKAFEPRIIEVAETFGPKGVKFYAVNPNDDAKFAEETLANMKARAIEKEYPFPYLKDGDSKIARAYGARVTPHVFVVDGKGTVVYRGYVDDSAKKDERKTTGLTDALNSLLNGREIANADTRAFGCTIKWKS
jgi:thiol-disulfide isomerase/thioredoxin